MLASDLVGQSFHLFSQISYDKMYQTPQHNEIYRTHLHVRLRIHILTARAAALPPAIRVSRSFLLSRASSKRIAGLRPSSLLTSPMTQPGATRYPACQRQSSCHPSIRQRKSTRESLLCTLHGRSVLRSRYSWPVIIKSLCKFGWYLYNYPIMLEAALQDPCHKRVSKSTFLVTDSLSQSTTADQ